MATDAAIREPARTMSGRAFAVCLAIVAVGAFVVRIVYILTIARHDPVGFNDSVYFHVQANLLARGHGFAEPLTWLQTGRIVPAAVHPPLYTIALASSSVLGFTSYFAHKVVSCLIGTATVVVVGLLGRDIAGPRAGLIAAVVALAYPNLWVVDGILLSEGLFALLVALALLAAIRFARRPRFLTAALLGVAIALASLTRGEGLFLTVLLALPVALLARGLTLREKALRLGVMAVAVVVVLAPWFLRNANRFQHTVLLSTNSGDVLAQANCKQTYYGSHLGFWWFPCGQITVKGDTSVRSAAQRDKAVRYIRAHKGRLPVVIAARLGRVWGVFRPSQQPHYDTVEGRDYHVAVWGLRTYWFLLPFAIAGGVILGRRRRDGTLLVLLAPVVMVIFTAVTTYGTTRFRIGAEPTIVLLAAVAADAVVRALRSRGDRSGGLGGEPVAENAAAVSSPVPAPPTISHP
jgi:4-amino-4-deoxy-L-arabinose transferase-like glycosyltransferase